MGVMAKDNGGGDFMQPPVGVHPALCIDVIDLGVVKTPFKDEKTGADKYAHQIQIVWVAHCENEHGEVLLRDDGKPFRLSKFYTLSLNERSNLRKDLDSWRGKSFTDEELAEGFDVEKLLGVQCNLNLVEKKKKGSDKTQVVVENVLPKNRRDPAIDQPEYTREKDRPGGRDTRSPKQGQGGFKPPAPPQQDGIDDDDDLPF